MTGWCPGGDRETWDGRVRRKNWSRGQGWKGRGGEMSVGDFGEEGGFRQKWEELANGEPKKLDN